MAISLASYFDNRESPATLNDQERALYLAFRRRSKPRFKTVYRGTSRLRGFANPADPNDQGFYFDRLFYFGDKAKQALTDWTEVTDALTTDQPWVELQNPNGQQIALLVGELNRVVPDLIREGLLPPTVASINAADVTRRFEQSGRLSQFRLRNLLLFMLHKLGQDVHNAFYPVSVLVSTTTSHSLAFDTFAMDEVRKGTVDKCITMEYWLPRNYSLMAVDHKYLAEYRDVLPNEWPFEIEKEIAVVGGLFPHSIIAISEYESGHPTRKMVNPHLMARLQDEPAFTLSRDARIPIDQTYFDVRLRTETRYRAYYLSHSDTWIENFRA